MARRKARPRPPLRPIPERPNSGPESPDDPNGFAQFGEWLRRAALGLTAALIVARAYWPGEWASESDTLTGLGWTVAVLLAAALAILSWLVGGITRLRLSWTDAAVLALMLLVGLSAGHAADRRVAINLAWQWGGVGVAYVLVRNLPRTRGESSALAGVLVATATAVAAYGLYQVPIEFPQDRAAVLADPETAMRLAGVSPTPAAWEQFRNRVLGSNEPYSTFALTNSLAGFLVGPLALTLIMGWEGLRRLTRPGERGSPGEPIAGPTALILGTLPALTILACLVLTKSRSAYLGLLVALVVWGWRSWGKLPSRRLLAVGAGLIAGLGVLVAGAIATGGLDRQVWTEAPKSLSYRLEWWRGTWSLLRSEPDAWWWGLGPGNFRGPYLRHKLPQSSEEIADPHNLFLETWTTAGLPAVLVLLAALGLGLRDLLAPAPGRQKDLDSNGTPPPSAEPGAPPARAIWLVICAGGSWFLVVLMGWLNPFLPGQERMLWRWLILGAGWAGTILLGAPLWRRVSIPGAALGAGVLAVAVNLLAAGGIGIAPVALGPWTLLALGQNLRDDRPCGRWRIVAGRGWAFGLAMIWSALVGTFYGAVVPAWRARMELAEAEAALSARPVNLQRALEAYDRASQADVYAVEPWLNQAEWKFQALVSSGLPASEASWRQAWLQVLNDLDEARQPPRNPNSLAVHLMRARFAREVLRRFPDSLPEAQRQVLRDQIVRATQKATQLHPTDATLHADLAEALADQGRWDAALTEADAALSLHRATPHLDKKLPPDLLKRLQDERTSWSKRAQGKTEGGPD